MTRMQTLTRELLEARAAYRDNPTDDNLSRACALKRRIDSLTRSRSLARARRQVLYDINGHHGAA